LSYIRAIRSSDLKTTQKITAIMIASHYDFTKGDPAFPSNKLLAKETGLGISTVVKAKKVLSERGYLCSKMQWDNSCLYTPMLPDSSHPALSEKLNTHINTHINTNINTHINEKKSSNEDLVLSNISIKEGITTIEEESSDSLSLAEVRAMAADDIWAVFESR
jgi:DNA-binding transcriptional MocR family regulator